MNRTVLISLGVLVVAVCVFAYLNAADSEDRLRNQREAQIFVVAGGDRTPVDFDAILKLEEYSFEATLRSSDGTVRDHTYGGVRMRDLLDHSGVDLAGAEQVITHAVDGYTVALSADEVLQEDNVYVVYMIDGEPMAPREDGGSGPYQLVIREDEFGQRWNKYLMEIEVR